MKANDTNCSIFSIVRQFCESHDHPPTIAQIAEYAHLTICSVLTVVLASKKLDYTVGAVDGERDDGAGWTVEVV